MAYNYINETGIIIADTSDIRSTVEQEFKDSFNNQDLVVDNGSPASVLITAETTSRKNLQETAALLANQINPNIAGGTFLDALWALTNGQRIAATSTTVTATIAGVSGTVIPSGSVAETTDGDRFQTISEITIPLSGTIDVSFQAVEAGAVSCLSGTLINISDGGVLGWETVTNLSDGVIGKETQSDASARVDRRLTLSLGSKAVLFAIISGLYSIDDVNSLYIQENYEDTEEVINGVTMDPHSIYLCIDGATDDEVTTALYEYKTLGCGYNDGASGFPITNTIQTPDTDKNYTAKFDRPDEVIVKIKISVRAVASATNVVEDIKAMILAYADSDIRTEGFKVGIDVSPLEIAASVALGTDYFVTSCQVTKQVDDSFQSDAIAIDVWEKAYVTENLIEVIVV